MEKTTVLHLKGLILEMGKTDPGIRSLTGSPLLSTYCVPGTGVDGTDGVTPALVALTAQWGNSGKEHMNKYAISIML